MGLGARLGTCRTGSAPSGANPNAASCTDDEASGSGHPAAGQQPQPWPRTHHVCKGRKRLTGAPRAPGRGRPLPSSPGPASGSSGKPTFV